MSGTTTAESEITVVLADDHGVVRGALRALLDGQPDVHVVGEAGDLGAARAEVAARHPDVIVLDVNMPDGLGVEAVDELRQLSPVTQSSC